MKGWIGRQLNLPPKSWAFWSVIAGLILSGLGMYFGWDWLRSGATEEEPNSTTIRNAGIVIAGIFALVFALWRGLVAERQAASSQHQAETSQQGLLNERYQKGAEMLGSEVLAVRLGGIYALQRLAEEHPEGYHVPIMRLLCAYVRNPTGEALGPVLVHDEADKPIHELREDVQAVMLAIGSRTDPSIALEKSDTNFQLDLRNSRLKRAQLDHLVLSGAILDAADLSDASIAEANLSDASLWRANLSEAALDGADLSGAFLRGSILLNASLDGTVLSRASLEGVNLSDASLIGASLSDASLLRANLSDTALDETDLSEASFENSNLSRASLSYANLTGTDLENANLTGASFNRRGREGDPQLPARGLTQEQLNEARSDPGNTPDLEGVLDAGTGEQLVWQGLTVDEDQASDS